MSHVLRLRFGLKYPVLVGLKKERPVFVALSQQQTQRWLCKKQPFDAAISAVEKHPRLVTKKLLIV